jgi:hypothetical protein
MHAAMAGAINLARRHLISNFPKEGEWLLTTAIAMGFTDLLRNATPAAQAALVAAANDKLEGTRWRIADRVQ